MEGREQLDPSSPPGQPCGDAIPSVLYNGNESQPLREALLRLSCQGFTEGPTLQTEAEQGGLLINHFSITHTEKKGVLTNMAARTGTA